jgi:hypothetical protein
MMKRFALVLAAAASLWVAVPAAPAGAATDFLSCVRWRESRNNYTAQNPTSSASGAYQFIDGTWRTVSVKAGHGGYGRALHAPPYVQDAVARWTAIHVGRSPWAATGCTGPIK